MLIESTGLVEAIERMSARSERLKDLSEAMRSFGEGLVTKIDDGFNTEKNFDGTAFEPLKASTLAARASSHAGGKHGYKASRAELHKKLTAAGKDGTQIAKALAKHATAYQLKRTHFKAGLTSEEQVGALEKLRIAYEKRRAKLQLAAHPSAKGSQINQLKRAQDSYERKRKAIAAPAPSHKILTDTARARNSNHTSDVTDDSVRWSAVGYLAYHMSGTRHMAARNPTAFVWDGSNWVLHVKAKETLSQTLTTYIFKGETP